MEPGVVQQPRELLVDALEHTAIEVDEVHLVDREHERRDAEQPGDLRVAPRLHAHAVPRVDEQDRDVGRGGAGRHVARVLFVTRCIGQDELAARGREIPVGDVDRDALFALRSQP